MVRGVDEVGAQCDLHAAGIGGAIHRGNDGHGTLDDRADGALENQVLVLPLLIGHAEAFLQVAAGAEGARAGTGEHNATLLVGRGVDRVEQRKQVDAHLRVHRVGDFGAVQGDLQRMRLRFRGLQRVVRHRHGGVLRMNPCWCISLTPSGLGCEPALMAHDLIVVGGGLVGGAIAWGAAAKGASVALLDQGDGAYRAARGNFGLVWVQSKGAGMPPYAHWTRTSSELWPELAGALAGATGVDVALRQPGGLAFCLSDAEMESRAALLHRMHNESGDIGTRMLDRTEVRAMVPGLGDRVVGASFCPIDGHANPLHLLRALHAGLLRLGGEYLPGHTVDAIDAAPNSFTVRCGAERFTAAKL